MKRMALLAIGAAAALVALFGANIGGVHVGAVARVLLLSAGLVFIVLAVYLIAGARIGAHVAANRSRYVKGAVASAFLLTGAAVLAAYVYIATLGTWTDWVPTTNYYDRLASAFRAGHIYMPETPSPALLALPNPYDPEARQGILDTDAQVPGSIWDMSMYRGRVYLYWGPAPALMLLPLKGILPLAIGDQTLTFIFLLGSFVFQSLLLARLWRRFFADVPAWTVVLGMLFAGLANPIPWLLFYPRIYEAAIASGQFFLVAGLYFAVSALDRPAVSAWRLALAALAWALSAGSRATLAVAVATLSLMVLGWLIWKHRIEQGARVPLKAIAAFAAPLTLGAVVLAWYNFVRFGSIFEFGFRYALTMLDQNRYHQVLFSPVYLLPNLFIYLFNPPELSSLFPFVKPVWNGDFVAAFNKHFHAIYQSERIIGTIYVAPFLLFALMPLVYVARSARQARQAARSPGMWALDSDSFFRWFVLALLGSAVVQLFVVLLLYYATMRYFLDTSAFWVLLSVVGLWLGYRRLLAKPLWKWSYALLAVVLAVVSIVMAILIGFSTDVPRLKAANPSLIPHLRLFFMALARHLSR